MSPVERSAGGGGGGLTSPLTTKGDVWGFSTVNARIPVGTDGQVLTAASGQTIGVQWQSLTLDLVTQSTDLTVTANSAATAQTFIDGNAITFDGATRVKLEFYSAGVFSSVGACVIELYDGATDLGRLSQSALAAGVPYMAAVILTPSAGAHTYHVKAWRSNAGSTASVVGTSGGVFLPAYYAILRI